MNFSASQERVPNQARLAKDFVIKSQRDGIKPRGSQIQQETSKEDLGFSQMNMLYDNSPQNSIHKSDYKGKSDFRNGSPRTVQENLRSQMIQKTSFNTVQKNNNNNNNIILAPSQQNSENIKHIKREQHILQRDISPQNSDEKSLKQGSPQIQLDKKIKLKTRLTSRRAHLDSNILNEQLQ